MFIPINLLRNIGEYITYAVLGENYQAKFDAIYLDNDTTITMISRSTYPIGVYGIK